METLAIFGGISIGLVWGWLIALLGAQIRFRLSPLLMIGIASLLLAIEVRWFLGVAEMILALGASSLSLTLHTMWRRLLLQQLNNHNTN